MHRILPDLDIERVEYPQIQKTIRPDVDAKSIRLDVYVKDKQETVYDIEMQTVDTKEIPKRSRYYHSMIDLQMIDRGETYHKLNRSFVIFICLFDVFGKGRHKYTFEKICKEDTSISMNDGITTIFLNAQGILDDVGQELKTFLDYTAGKNPQDSFTEQLEEALAAAKKNREWRLEYMTLYMRDQENIEKGREEGKAEEREKSIRIAVSLLKELNMPEAAIMKKLQEKYKLTEEAAKTYL